MRNQENDIHLEKGGQTVNIKPGGRRYSGKILIFAFGETAVKIIDKYIPEHREHKARTIINYAPPIEMFQELKAEGFAEPVTLPVQKFVLF